MRPDFVTYDHSSYFTMYCTHFLESLLIIFMLYTRVHLKRNCLFKKFNSNIFHLQETKFKVLSQARDVHCIMASGKQALKVLQSAAAFIPVPLIREAVGVALKIMEVCEERCEVCMIPPMKYCKIINNILLLPEYIRRW